MWAFESGAALKVHFNCQSLARNVDQGALSRVSSVPGSSVVYFAEHVAPHMNTGPRPARYSWRQGTVWKAPELPIPWAQILRRGPAVALAGFLPAGRGSVVRHQRVCQVKVRRSRFQCRAEAGRFLFNVIWQGGLRPGPWCCWSSTACRECSWPGQCLPALLWRWRR
jgi:hypothetical protein